MDFLQLNNAQGLHLVKCHGCEKPGGLIPYHPDDDTRYDTRGRVAILLDGSLAFQFKGGIAKDLRNSLSYGIACMSCGFDYGIIRPSSIAERNFFAPRLAEQYKTGPKEGPTSVGPAAIEEGLPKAVILPKFIPKQSTPPPDKPRGVSITSRPTPVSNINNRPKPSIGGYQGEL